MFQLWWSRENAFLYNYSFNFDGIINQLDICEISESSNWNVLFTVLIVVMQRTNLCKFCSNAVAFLWNARIRNCRWLSFKTFTSHSFDPDDPLLHSYSTTITNQYIFPLATHLRHTLKWLKFRNCARCQLYSWEFVLCKRSGKFVRRTNAGRNCLGIFCWDNSKKC